MNSPEHKCPLCYDGIICSAFKPIQITCFLCDKKGNLTDKQWNDYQEGRRLREARIKTGITMREFANKHRMSPIEISEIEMGMRKAPEGIYE